MRGGANLHGAVYGAAREENGATDSRIRDEKVSERLDEIMKNGKMFVAGRGFSGDVNGCSRRKNNLRL